MSQYRPKRGQYTTIHTFAGKQTPLLGEIEPSSAVGVFMHDARRRWGSVFWRSWARVIRTRLPVIGQPNADILRHGPPPAYARGRVAAGGAEVWPQVHPGVVHGARAAAGG